MRKTFSLPVAATAAGGGPTPPPADTVDNIEHSVRFNSADSAYLSRTPSSAGNRKTWTWSGWVKRSGLGNLQHIFQGAVGSTDVLTFLRFNADDTLRLGSYNAGYQFNLTSNAVFRDTSAWYHIVVSVDTTQSTSTDRLKIYVNGEETTSFSTSDYPSQNFEGYVNISDNHHIGRYNGNTTRNFDGYLANIHFIDGQALTPSSFGFTDSDNVWQPKAYSGSYGTNGFHLDFADTSSATALGNDVSGNNNDWTPNNLVAGPAYTANSFSTEFDGTGDYLTVPSSTDFALGTGDFTIEFWAKPTAAWGAGDTVLASGTVNQTDTWLMMVATNKLLFRSNGQTDIEQASASLSGWNHIAAVRSGSTVNLYLNGTSVGSGTYANSISANAITIGSQPGGSGEYTGYLSNLRIIKGRALYTAAFTPPSTALTATDDTVLLTCQDATVRDNSNIGHDVTASGDVAVVNEGPFNGYSGEFNGSSDYLEIPASTDFSFTTAPWTFEFWVYHDDWTTGADGNGFQYLISPQQPSHPSYPVSIAVHQGRYIIIEGANYGSPWYSSYNNIGSYGTAASLNTWNHVAYTRDSSGVDRVFVNGALQFSATGKTATAASISSVCRIGRFGSSGFSGKLSNVRLTKGQALYTAAFTPPTADLTTTSQGATASNVKLLTCQNSTFIDNSPSAHTITANGNAHTVSVNPHTDKYSVTFDGSSDKLTATSSEFAFGTGDYTVEAWVYVNSLTSTDTIVATGTSSAATTWQLDVYSGSSGYLRFIYSGSSVLTGTVSLNTWHHVAATRSGTTVRLFVDGVQQSSTTDSSNLTDTALKIGENRAGTAWFNGKISNLRLTKGQALYTSNFLPSKEDLTTTSQGATASNVKLLTCQSYKIQDNSPSAHTITVNGDAKPSTVAPFVTSGAGSFDGTGDYLTTANHASDFNFGSSDFTMEFWVNSTQTGRTDPIGWDYNYSSTGWAGMILNISPGSGSMAWFENTSSRISGSGSWNDGSWHHIAVTRDGNSVKMFLDGTQIGSTYTTSHSYGAANSGLIVGALSGGTNSLNGKISNVRISKGLARYTSNFTPPTEDFDPTDQDTTFLALQGNTLDDLSGNDHVVTANGNAATSTVSPFEPVDGSDAMLDSPTNYGSGDTVRGNYCTLNPLDKATNGSAINGNVEYLSTGGYPNDINGTMAASSGKWYYEAIATNNAYGSGGPTFHAGFINLDIWDHLFDSVLYIKTGFYGYSYREGNKSVNGTSTSFATGAAIGDVIGFALDLDAGELEIYKNGTSLGVLATGLSGTFMPTVGSYTSSTGQTATVNFGQQPFKYPLAGYKSLCSTNLPTPAVADGSTAMDVALYTGTGTAQSISTPNLSPDLVWLKIRNTTGSHGLWDSVRGTSSRLVSNSTGAEDTTVGVTALSSNGFTVDGPYNTASNNWAAWTWDAGSSTVSNTDGTVTSQVRVNPTAGISIATFTGSGAGSFGHGLTKTPAFVITKKTAASGSWNIYHEATGVDKYLIFSTADAGLSTGIWSGTNSSVVGFSSNNNCSVGDNVAYCFAPVEGFSSFGSYVGDGSSSNGPFVYTGMRPKWIMIKDTTGSTNHWVIYDTERDTYNESGKRLAANLADQEGASGTLGSGIGGIDILSNGFKIDIAGGNHNTLNSTYIYAAFAEHPFKTSRAR